MTIRGRLIAGQNFGAELESIRVDSNCDGSPIKVEAVGKP